MSPTSIAAYLVLFGSVGLLFLLVSLLLGRLLRADTPTLAKLDVYECGEPAVGTSFVQFDLRFYVVALMFIVFEVELALFFPPATIFGTATHWMKPQTSPDVSGSLDADLGMKQESAPPPALPGSNTASAGSIRLYLQAARLAGNGPTTEDLHRLDVAAAVEAEDACTLALTAAADLAAFFALILLGFAYVWRRGDLNWVRAIDSPQSRSSRKLQIVR
jgi:NADH-quinone oxidoreductase subunit A